MEKGHQDLLDTKISAHKEFSKELVRKSFYIAVILTIALFIGSMFGKDMSAFSNVVLASWAELSGINAFYIWKARAENKIKIIASLPKEVIEKIEVLRDFLN